MITQVAVGKNLIGGQWMAGSDGGTFTSVNPSDSEEVLGSLPRSGTRDIDLAVKAAREAFPTWKSLSRIRRGEFMDAFAQLVKRDSEEIARLMSRECGKAINEARADVTEGLHMVQFQAGRTRMPYGEVLASEIAEKDSLVLRKPKGVVACITPWNFPFAIPLWLVASAITEGNTVVFKPAEETPLVGQRIAELFEEAGLPPGVLNLVQGHGEEAGWPLVNHPDVDVVLFTGSYEVGSRIKQACAASPGKMAVCEMGGKNAIIIFDDANLDIAVNAAILSAFKTTGQRCVSASRLIVQEGILERFTQGFLEMARRMKIGGPLDESVFMGPLITPEAVEKVLRYNELARKEGVHVLLEGGRLTGPAYDRGNFVSPFVYRMEHSSQSRVLREEVFGPHVAIIPFKTVEDAFRIYNDSEYGFALAVITEDYRKIHMAREVCEFGVGYVNLPTIGAEVHLPFGGLKRSGTGMPSAAALIDAVTHRVSWTVNHAPEIKMAQGLSASVD
ncbi:MAG: aldehyde dehydrogenase family protein [Chloroflexi bacterium]|nr:aldehyde dehydrogenase family protein [Chloroflexota bacterium]